MQRHVADREGYRLLRNAEVQAAVQEGRATLLAHAAVTAQRVLEEMRRIALFDIATLFDCEGHLLPVLRAHELQGRLDQAVMKSRTIVP